ncbi:hypothetical protein BKA64DRAFT_705755 [Cadophora sp. MPI-SDFR-AT-0126]|nr:hypothetical protein BKA64DRAFT_705755 [Leotiomycetes sp. MPI-SDFR-AT-0126]
MRFVAVLVPAFLAFAGNCAAWTKDGNGVWVANNTWYTIGALRVHESCTTMNTVNVHADGAFCAYWTDSHGNQFKGKCSKCNKVVSCAPADEPAGCS